MCQLQCKLYQEYDETELQVDRESLAVLSENNY